jgi:hypothetical protein
MYDLACMYVRAVHNIFVYVSWGVIRQPWSVCGTHACMHMCRITQVYLSLFVPSINVQAQVPF